MIKVERVVIWFSAGVTSAIAAKVAVDKYRSLYPCHLVNTDTGSEDDDNLRFMHDVSTWLDLPLEIIRNDKYEDTFAVYDDVRFLTSPHGARCTTELKKKPRLKYQNLGTDLQVFGYDASEQKRADRFVQNTPSLTASFPFILQRITHSEFRQILLPDGIAQLLPSSLGFKNANCLKSGCVTGGMGYSNHLRKASPEVFWNMAKKERELNYAINSIEKREDGKRVKVPVFLDEMDSDAGNYDAEPAFQCGLFCGIN